MKKIKKTLMFRIASLFFLGIIIAFFCLTPGILPDKLHQTGKIYSEPLVCKAAKIKKEKAKETGGVSSYELQVPFPEFKSVDPTQGTTGIAKYIKTIYHYAIGVVGILAAVVLMFGGVLWLTAGGNPSRIENAKAWIGSSLAGLVIALASYGILYTLNPSLVNFHTKQLKMAKNFGVEKDCVSDGKSCTIRNPNPTDKPNCNKCCDDWHFVGDPGEGKACGPASEGGMCADKDDCKDGSYCVEGECYDGGEGDPCNKDKQCDGMECISDQSAEAAGYFICSSDCSSCGDGGINVCDEDECLDLGCKFIDGGVGDCVEK